MSQAAPEILVYPTREALAAGLAGRLADRLRQRVEQTGRARIAVPGGTTPGPMLSRLGAAGLPWQAVTVTLTDERRVPTSDPRSNRRLLGETLLAGRAAAATFVPLYDGGAEPGESLAATAAALERLALPLDLAVLGLGTDLHTASLFPGAPGLEAALAPDAPAAVATVQPGSGEPRITLPARVLAAAGERHILIAGADKRAALERAVSIGDPRAAPVCALLDGALVHFAE
ncbi:6-phosphogluconolactonase [Tistlia consotensis]|uniref:6-phosphogluconolactonase n=1 Tax=Tistlia consotensis USBA 355 TaxID=560819 RepID=A0A1Y6C0Q8_9PROT|nr:6-phosphogluconolactonase [Tistlia consotensis]SMF29570.1 6-phosphogluconolactonase [Tistlia consotensis USBA 355]SNR91139.1 6-phosphogluconolactonase [Tistlia consotensis]